MAESRTSARSQLRDLAPPLADAATPTRSAETVLAATRAATRGERVNTRDAGPDGGQRDAEYLRELTRINPEYAKALRELTTDTGAAGCRSDGQGGHRPHAACPDRRARCRQHPQTG